MIQLVGLDPGFANLGYARLVIAPHGRDVRVEEMGVFRTQKSDKKLKVFSADDNVRRALLIAKFLRELCASNHRTVGLCAEAMSFPRSASVAAKMAMTWGTIASLSEACAIPILQVSPQELKKQLAGAKSATKEEVQLAVERLYPETVRLRSAYAEGLHEHCFDAVAAAHVMLSSESVQMLRRVA